MKLPFHTVLGPMLKTNIKPIKSLCRYPLLRFSPIYVGCLGIVGLILSVFDIIRIIHCGPILPGYLRRSKIGTLITPQMERDFKLICLVWSFEYYSLLLIGLLTQNPIFFLPFLILYAAIVLLELAIFAMRILCDGICFSKTTLIMSVFMIFNWFSVFCTFFQSMTRCDL
ncbi:uncharacterized protein LOC109596935 [Aethina tumida]|uniref:uncharacterized protein LOC109596935 n=1 Tax=Aethina tumida TaxID=116153 RepID=UPI00096B0B60|nr:uncharacterized protein LOC109596935 [Aethina tumida]